MTPAPGRHTQGYVPVDHGHLFYERTGMGPSVVFVHAGVADRTMWRPQVEALCPAYDVVVFDSRGYGLSLSDPVEFSPVDDLVALLDQLELERPVLAGCSRGAGHCLDFAMQWPERTAGLVCVSATLSGLDFQPSPEEEALFAQVKEAYQARDWNAAAELETRVWLDGPAAPEGRVEPPVRGGVSAMIQRVRSSPRDDVQPRPPAQPAAKNLGQVQCPTLVVVGALDTPYVRKTADVLGAEIRTVERVDFLDSAHLPNLEHPQRFNDALASFLERIV